MRLLARRKHRLPNIDVVELGPNDRIAISFDKPISADAALEYRNLLEEWLTSGNRYAIFDQKPHITVIRERA